MPTSQWPGLVTAASPFAIPPTAAVEQTNLACNVPGQIYVRGGMRKVAVVGGSPDILDCFPYEKDGKSALISMLPDGRIVFQPSPAYGWQSKVPYEPDLGGSPLVTTGYTQRFVEGVADSFDPPDPELDPNPGGGWSGGDASDCKESLLGGTAYVFVATPRLDASGCAEQLLEQAFDGGTALSVADCLEVVTGLCGADPNPNPTPPEGAVPSAPRNVNATFIASGATVAWQAPLYDGGSPVLSYDMEVSTEGGNTPTPLPDALDPPIVTAWGNTSATLRLWPIGQSLPSGWTLDLEQEVAQSVPGAPQVVDAYLNGVGNVHVVWTPPSSNGGSAITQYRVYYNGGSSAVATYSGDPTFGLSVTFTPDPEPSGTEAVRVSAVNAVGEGPKSSPFTVET